MTRFILVPSHNLQTASVLRHSSRSFCRRLLTAMMAVIGLVAVLVLPVGRASAQQAPLHLNPVVEKLAHGEAIIGTQTDDMSLQNCRSLSRLNFDYTYVDMEHGPLNLDGLAYCVAAMVDKAAVLKKGNAQPNVALFARFPPYGRDLESNDWIVKQALDMGLMGVIFNGVENKEQMMRLIQFMRYPQLKTSKYQQPSGLRGYGPGNAAFVWGVSADEYERHADVWPLNPEGDLLAIPMIETLEGLKNANEIAAVPGVGAIFIGAGGDLHQYLGVSRDSAEVEQARQTILAACKAHNVACGITALTKADVDKRLKEGWKMIRTGRGE
ncbi:MAG TPA: aldolase/citrate lyase family protein [Candidatus Acidoferrales bacterium]|nr:aldolase/citrate lyase family protein [Candidatus Acidoferrales bacterium]